MVFGRKGFYAAEASVRPPGYTTGGTHILALEEAIRSNALLSFGDATWKGATELEAIELLAAIPEDADDFNVRRPAGEIKFDFVKKMFLDDKKKNKDVAERAKWDKAVAQAKVYVFDPKTAVSRLQASESYTELKQSKGLTVAEDWLYDQVGIHSAMLAPSVWLHATEIIDQSTSISPGNLRLMRVQARSFWKSCVNLQNLRRQMLNQQHLYVHVLDERPYNSAFDERGYISKVSVRLPELVVSLATPFTMDDGHADFDIPLIDQGRQEHRERLRSYSFYHYLPTYTPGVVNVVSSKSEFRVQLADVAAGRARQLYQQEGLEALTELFPTLHFNGRRLSKSKPVFVTGGKGGLISL